jgi:hypothetical protein
MKTKRQRIVDAVVARMQTIRQANGFETDAGALVEPWAVRFDEEELAAQPSKCALAVYDLPDDVSKESKHSKGSTHRLRFQVRAFVTKGDRAEQLRAIIGDIVSAVGSDTHWTEGATGKFLAIDTEPGEEGFVVPQDAMEIAGGAVEFTVVYATALFDPYN